jgi:predicted ATP-grasp superfamily ATP-dependent carboligase
VSIWRFAAKARAAPVPGECRCALVLDAHLKSSLAAIRSLGRKRIPIIAGSHRGTAMGFYSRYASGTFQYPSPLTDRAGFVDAISSQVKKLGPCPLFAFSDSTLLPLVTQHRAGLSDSLLYPLPLQLENFHTAFDKGLTLQLARSLGLETPRTWIIGSIGDLDDIEAQVSYPVVLKPRRTVYWNNNSGVQRTAVFALSRKDLIEKCNHLVKRTGEFPLLQKYIVGEETGVEFLCHHGQILAACAHRRLRSASPTGGSGVLTETVSLDYCGTAQRAERLVSALQWSGPIMVEFKICRETSIPYLMEINGRFWGSLALASAAGVDFPLLQYQLACGKIFPQQMNYNSGVVLRHLKGDFAHFMSVIFKSDPMRQFAYPTRWKAIRSFVSSSVGCSPSVFDRRDPKPVLAELLDTLCLVLRKQHIY